VSTGEVRIFATPRQIWGGKIRLWVPQVYLLSVIDARWLAKAGRQCNGYRDACHAFQMRDFTAKSCPQKKLTREKAGKYERNTNYLFLGLILYSIVIPQKGRTVVYIYRSFGRVSRSFWASCSFFLHIIERHITNQHGDITSNKKGYTGFNQQSDGGYGATCYGDMI